MADQTVDRFHVIQGETVRLVAQFERNGMVYDPYQVSTMTILDPDDVYVASGAPQRESEGVYFFDWDIPEGQTAGVYTDQWSYLAKSNSAARTRENSFTLRAGDWSVKDQRTSWTGFLFANQVYTVTVSRYISDTTGKALSKDYVFYFTTEYSPLYADVRGIRAMLGNLMQDLSDDDINMAAFKASLDAAYLYFIHNGTYLTEPPPTIVWNWVRCRAAFDLLDRRLCDMIEDGIGITKILGDFTIQKLGQERLSGMKLKMKEMEACMEKWALYPKSKQFISFIKGVKKTPYPLGYRNRKLRRLSTDAYDVNHFDRTWRDYGTKSREDGDLH